MGCTLNHTLRDHQQALESRSKEIPHVSKERREAIRTALHRSSRSALLSILSDPKNPAYGAVKSLLARSVVSEMTAQERDALPWAVRVILDKHPRAMGLFEKAPAHYGPGASPVQHHYEIFSTAALMQKTYKTLSGKNLRISDTDRVDFGIKLAKAYAQPTLGHTIEADILIGKGSPLSYRTLGIDCKFSKSGVYGIKTEGLQRQLDGIRTALRDGKLDEFCFVTNGRFSQGFKEVVTAQNLKIAKDFAEKTNRLYQDEKHGIDKQYLTPAEKESIPTGKIPRDMFKEYSGKVREFVEHYGVPQVDLCEGVNFKGT